MQKRFSDLRERLLRAGVAPRHVRRYLRELSDHLADLRAEEERAGRSGNEAEAAALARLGSEEELAQAMIAKPELRAWSVRAPWAVFGLGSLGCVAATYGAACAILWTGWRLFMPGRETPFVPIDTGDLAIAYFGLGKLLYFGGPVLAGWGVAMLAARQRMRAMWPAVGMAAVALIAALVQVHVRRPDAGSASGQVSLGLALGTTTGAMLAQLAYATVLFVAVLLPYAAWRRWRVGAAE